MLVEPGKMWFQAKLAGAPLAGQTGHHFQDVIQVRMLQDLVGVNAKSIERIHSKRDKKTERRKNKSTSSGKIEKSRQVEEEKRLARGVLILFSMILLFDAKPCDSAKLVDLTLKNQGK